MTDCANCPKDHFCCGAYTVTLHPDEAKKFKHREIRTLKENNKKLGYVWALLRDEEGFCLYFDKNTKLCTVHSFKPEACKEYQCQMK